MEKNIEKYAELIIKTGINIQKGQILVINSPVEVACFTRILVEKAYYLGASEVVVNWSDEQINKLKYKYAADEVFDVFPEWQKESIEFYRKRGAGFLSISCEDPDLLKNVDKDRVARYQKARSIALKDYYINVMNNANQWCVISVPTKAWAKKIFPECEENEAINELWKLILKMVRADKENPVLEWENHNKILANRMKYLNEKQFVKLVYKNERGTNLEIGLPEGHKWLGGKEYSKQGIMFNANIPTEEIFTAPLRECVNGVVVSSKPLIYGGNVINNFELHFKDGKVIKYKAEVGEETLEKILNFDDNSKYLGEVALVEDTSLISQSGKVFYNTLFDENASCHLALGAAYSVCIEGGDKLSEEELLKKGINCSMTHEDFMIGTSDMRIVGIDEAGDETVIMENGVFTF